MTKKDFSQLTNPADQFMDEMEATTASQTNRTAKAPKEKPERRTQHASFL